MPGMGHTPEAPKGGPGGRSPPGRVILVCFAPFHTNLGVYINIPDTVDGKKNRPPGGLRPPGPPFGASAGGGSGGGAPRIYEVEFRTEL